MFTLSAVKVTIRQPHPGEEFPVGAEVPVAGSAVGTGGAEPHPIDLVTVQVDAGPVVEATLSRTSPPSFSVGWTATIRLAEPGGHTIRVTATDDIGRMASRDVPVATVGTPHCRPGILWQNYPRTRSLTPTSTCVPESLAGVVAAVREAEGAGRRAHASGSRWSFSDCAVTGDVSIDTRQLRRSIDGIQAALRPDVTSPVVHIEAGMTIRELYHRLDRLGLALETMGGAAGQTIAGAILTGTHGGDKALPPLADSMLALHLVGVGGVEHWIEPSVGITDPVRLRQHVAPGIDPTNIVYDDELFNASLVSLGCMGVVHAVVLRVREQYDLIETTVHTTWRAVQTDIAGLLADPTSRFLQAIVSPYPDTTGENLCLVTMRAEAAATVPVTRSREALRGAVSSLLLELISFRPDAAIPLLHSGVLDESLPEDERLARLVEAVLTDFPDMLPVMVRHYGSFIGALWPTDPLRGLSYSVMDLGHGQPNRDAQPGHSTEVFFPAIGADGRLGCARFVDAAITAIAAANRTFFAGYVSIRFMAGTRAHLGMQQWPQTCAVEVSVVQGVRELPGLIERIYRDGINAGGLPHWGQQVDMAGPPDYGGVYPHYPRWRQAYGRLSRNFTTRTFATELSDRWNLTRPSDATFDSQVGPAEVLVGRSSVVTVSMRNSGVSTWTTGGRFVLAPQASPSAAAWNLQDVPVPADVPQGAQTTFQINVTAPSSPGTHRLSWRMREDGAGAFGGPTPGLPIRAVVAGPVTVPDVVGITGVAATRIIREAGLVPMLTGTTATPNHVGSQQPSAGTVVQPGSTVTLRLNPGLPP